MRLQLYLRFSIILPLKAWERQLQTVQTTQPRTQQKKSCGPPRVLGEISKQLQVSQSFNFAQFQELAPSWTKAQ